MKCAHCGHDSRRPERSEGRCPKCRQHFVFDPGDGDPLSDRSWLAAITQVSSEGSVRFTVANLHEAVARRIAPRRLGLGCGTFLFGAPFVVLPIALYVALGEALPLFLMLPVGVGLTFFAVRARLAGVRRPLSRSDFNALLRRWEKEHGRISGLIRPTSKPRALSPELADELAHYSFDRVVVCDRPETVDLLLGNDFHFENNCAILTMGGYPEHAAPMVARMLRTNPRLEVFVLHDATPEGCRLAHELRHDPAWFPDPGVRIFDVAIRPAQARRMSRLAWALPTRASVRPHPGLTDAERRWLGRFELHLAALSPEQIIKRLYRAMQQLPELASKAGGDSDGGVFIWTTDASASDGGGDSFG